MNRGAFTFIELLAVMAIIAMLAAFLFPVFGQARALGHRAVSLNNVKQITLANFLYIEDFDDTIAPNRNCNVFSPSAGESMDVLCRTGTATLGWIDLTVPYVRSYAVFKSPADFTRANPLPGGSVDFTGAPATHGILWGPRPLGFLIGGEYRSSYARNNNFANNGTYSARTGSAPYPANTILIYSFAPNSGGGASGMEGVPGASFTIVRHPSIQPASGTCSPYDARSTGNVRSNFFSILPAYAHGRELERLSSERYKGRGVYGFLDGHARSLRPEQIRGQCGWGNRIGGVEYGNDGTVPDFRF